MPDKMPGARRLHQPPDDDHISGTSNDRATAISTSQAATGVGRSGSTSIAPTSAGQPRLELSLTQILGSTAAAVTAAFLGSRLGVAGTLIGAALASVISVVGGTIYTNSIKATHRRMTKVIVAVRNQDDDERHQFGRPEFPVGRAPSSTFGAPVVVPPAVGDLVAVPPVRTAPPVGARRSRRPLIGGVIVGAALSAAVFAGALAVVTGYESVSGTPISGGHTGGLTILGGAGEHTAPSTRSPSNTAPASSSPAAGGEPVSSSPATATAATPTANVVPPISGSMSGTSPATAVTTASATSVADSGTIASAGQSTAASTDAPVSSGDGSASAPIGADSTTGAVPTGTETAVTETSAADGAVPADPNSTPTDPNSPR